MRQAHDGRALGSGSGGQVKAVTVATAESWHVVALKFLEVSSPFEWMAMPGLTMEIMLLQAWMVCSSHLDNAFHLDWALQADEPSLRPHFQNAKEIVWQKLA